jgi:hypothetical protein
MGWCEAGQPNGELRGANAFLESAYQRMCVSMAIDRSLENEDRRRRRVFAPLMD